MIEEQNQDTKKDPQAGLTDEEFACLIFRKCGDNRGVAYNLDAIFPNGNHKLSCGFCNGVYHAV